MKSNGSFEEISDGTLYGLNDMVKADTRGCVGCSACCYDVGDTIVLNPYDMAEIVKGSGQTYEQLLGHKIELHEEENIMLPNLKMVGEALGCGFLDEHQRCSIHQFRPSICRMFPLGRVYEGDDFGYFYKEGECILPNPSKIKVKKWIGIQNYQENKTFILEWYKFLKALKWRVKFIHDEDALKAVHDYVIQHFYNRTSQSDENFYQMIQQKMGEAKNQLGLL